MSTFDQIWIENRFRYRKAMSGTALRKDEETGYLEPVTKRGFTAKKKQGFLERFKVCSNKSQICKSIDIDIQAVYDAIALDEKFREDYVVCTGIAGRSKRLNDELIKALTSEKTQVISDLIKKTDIYK